MGRVIRKAYVCDFCGEAIREDHFLVGRLSLRKADARGLGRIFDIALHETCSEKLSRHAAPAASGRK